jgi:hypothetical protein
MEAMGRTITILAVALALGAAGCGDDETESTPVGCLQGPDAYIEGLDAAPDEVLVGETPLGDCLAEEQGGGQIAEVGGAILAAAEQLNQEARRRPLGDAPVQLGYLVGVVESRAQETGGIHRDLALNVESAATFIPNEEVLPGGFQQRYEEGLSAGGGSG